MPPASGPEPTRTLSKVEEQDGDEGTLAKRRMFTWPSCLSGGLCHMSIKTPSLPFFISLDPPFDKCEDKCGEGEGDAKSRGLLRGTFPSSHPHPLRERFMLIGMIFLLFVGGYYGIGSVVKSHGRTHALNTSLDDAIPFVPTFIFFYGWCYTAMFYPAFVIRCPYLFRRLCVAFMLVLSVCYTVWCAFPVSAANLRYDSNALDINAFDGWCVSLNYKLDPPVNCFPSLHVATAVLSGGSAWRARPVFGYIATPTVFVITLAVVFVKQHFVADAIVGFGLGVLAYYALVHRARTPAHNAAYSWWGPGLYLVLHCSVYLAVYVVFATGWKPM